MATHVLSKSTYMRGVQCPKALYLFKNRRDLMPPIDSARQGVFDTGTSVGVLARQLFPGGLDLQPQSSFDYSGSIEATRAAIESRAPVIYEAAFLFEDVLAALDILVLTSEGWKAYEVKSSGSVKDYHVRDAALQAHVIEGAGVLLADISIIHLNTSYVRDGELDLTRLFQIASIREEVSIERAQVGGRIADFKAMLATEQEPAVDIGPHCDEPFACDFMAHCWADEPAEGSILTLTRARGREWELRRRGVRRLVDVPEGEPLSLVQRRQVEGWRTGRVEVDRGELQRWLKDLRYPLYHFDFETFQAAVPPSIGTRPYQQIPFQYSAHAQVSPGVTPEHRYFLGEGGADPRESLTQRLIQDLGPEGDILAYHASFERDRIKELARDLPHHAAALLRILDRIKDLETPFLKGWFYAPAMNGRTSIKQVLPALVPELSYRDLSIQEGDTASRLYWQMSSGQYTGDVEKLRADLLAYCERDTMAMVRILSVLAGHA